MKTFLVDDDNNLVLRNGDFVLIEGKRAFLQTSIQYAKALVGEMVFDMGSGIPYFQSVFSQQANIAQFEAAYRKRMAQVDGFVAVVDFFGEIAGDVFRYYATLDSVFGKIEVQDGLPIR